MFAKDDIDFIRRRLEGTIVQYKEEPVYVNAVAKLLNDIRVTVTRLVDDVPDMALLEKLDLRPVSLGYINSPRKGAVWSCRAPIRAWQQGLCDGNFVTSREAINLWDNRRYIRDTIVGIYPTIQVASKSKIRKAFAKDFAIENNVIIYKDRADIGVYENDRVVLKDKYIYLQEYLQEVV